jgi:hypothetical protein
VIPPNQIPDAPEGKHERFASCDEAARPDIVEQLTNDPTFHKKMKRQLNAQPFYRFCGFGFTNPLYRKGFGFHFILKVIMLLHRTDKSQKNISP